MIENNFDDLFQRWESLRKERIMKKVLIETEINQSQNPRIIYKNQLCYYI
jgi:hypothetical protein